MPQRRSTLIFAILAALTATLTLAGCGSSSPKTEATLVEKLTGLDGPNNTYGRWNIKATDLGIMWDNNAGQVLTAFGDTYGDAWVGPGGGALGLGDGNWRSNVLLRSDDRVLADGMHFDSAVTAANGRAREVLPGLHQPDGTGEVTKIPTAGIAVGSRQYLGFMSVRHWGPPGQWDTNYARIAYSDDNGVTWSTAGAPIWNNPGFTDRFQQQSFARDGGYVYVYGTPSGRNGSAYLARVPEAQMLTQSAYQYWNGSTWIIADEGAAAAVVGGPVSELSVRHDAYSGKWLMMYLQGGEGIVLRSAPAATGPWSSAQVVVSSADYPILYGGFMHPWSSGGTIYFTMSQWNPYNVYLMKVQINTAAQIINPNLTDDPSFERGALDTGTGGFWACTDNCRIEDAPSSYSGDRNGFAGHNHGWQDMHQNVPVATHANYQLTGWIRTSPNSDNGFMGARTTSGAVISEAHYTAIGPWTRIVVNFNSGTNTSVVVYAGVWTDNGDIWVQLDDFSVVAT